MNNFKGDIPAIATVLTAAGVAVFHQEILAQAAFHLISGVAAHLIKDFPDVQKWKNIHPNDLNHNIKKLFVKSTDEALNNIYILFAETQATKNEKKDAKQLIKTLQKYLPDKLSDDNQVQLEEAEVKHFLYEKDKEEVICNYIIEQFDTFGITEPFKSFLAKNLPSQIQLCFGEGLKKPDNHEAWVAFQRMLIEEIRSDIKQIAKDQGSIKEDLSNLKFEKSGLSEKQIAEIHQLIDLLNNKKLVEVKIRSSIDQTLKSIENKANEIIQITTKTQITVDELKIIVEKIKRQNRTNHIIIYTLAACLIVVGIFVANKLINQPFTTTIKVYGWEGYEHNPLKGKGAITLDLNKPETVGINEQGIAVFTDIPPKYNGKTVIAHITETEGEPYYLSDSIIKIEKNTTIKVQVLLRGLEKLEGTIYDVSGEGLPDVLVTLAGISTTTDTKGNFSIDSIPIENQKQEQEIVISKDGYKSIRRTIPMEGGHKYRTVLELK